MMRRSLGPCRWIAAATLLGAACAAPAADLPVLVRGHSEVLIGDDETVTPLVLEADSEQVGLCLTLPDVRDTSRWQGTLSFGGRPVPAGAAPPAARIGSTLCFDGRLPPDLAPSRSIAFCLEIHDLYDDSRMAPSCAPIAYLPRHAERRRAISERRTEILGRVGAIATGELIVELDELAAAAAADELRMAAARVELIAIHYLTQKGTAVARAEARRRLAAMPAWTDRPEAGVIGPTVAFQRAELHRLTAGADELAWRHLEEAGRRYLELGSPMRFTVAMRQASLLARRGAGREARRRLRAALADCRRLGCPPQLEAQAQSDLAWHVALDPDASERELDAAARTFEAAAARLADGRFTRERAIQQINHGFVLLRRGRDPSAHLEAARGLLGDGGDGDELTARLLAWIDLGAGLHALAGSDLATALERCRPLALRPEPALATWALSCVGRAERLRGDLAAADRAFTRAVEQHTIGPVAIGRSADEVTPGPRADAFGHAARVAVERGDPERAWRLLEALDRLAEHEDARRGCRAAADEETLARWAEIDREAQEVQAELAALGDPLGGAREISVEPVREHLRQRLAELSRQAPGCDPPPTAGAAVAGLRAVPVEDEVILLERAAAGAVRLVRRTALSRQRLREIGDALDRAMAERRLDEAGWRDLTAELAAALLPPDLDRLAPVTVYSLHGPLQRIPVAALPLAPGATPGGHRWLGEATAVALRPAAAGAGPETRSEPPAAASEPGGAPLFVVDPRGDLASRAELEALYRSLFPRARVLAGEEATASALLAALPGAAWVHVDAHGAHDAGFPELSALRMADRPLAMLELARQPLRHRFVNLSACRTGRWPITADSGRYGIGGLLVRLGVPSVLAGAADLDDRVAADFNRELYRAIAGGEDVPAAYRRALRAVGRRHPPPSWAPLLLLHGGAAAPTVDAGAEIAAPRTPSEEETVRHALLPAGSDGKAGP